eukprot:3264394-Pyramimonas_sp.AAC.1
MRKEVLPDWLVDAACDTSDPEYEEELFLYGAFRHPGDVAPKPLCDGGVSLLCGMSRTSLLLLPRAVLT